MRIISRSFTLSCLGVILSLNSYSQSYLGAWSDNYGGITQAVYNPSEVMNSNYAVDINLFSVSALGGSDYFSINLDNILKSEEGFNFEDDSETFPSNANQFFMNVDFLGPSFMFALSPKHSIGVITRARTNFNLHNINGELYENMSENFNIGDSFNYNMENFSGTVHVWGEIGLAYAREILNKEEQFLKAGVTLKYLQGAGGLFVNSPNLSGDYDGTTNVLTSTGSLRYGSTIGFDNEDIEFEGLTSGFGADIGFSYEYRPMDLTKDAIDLHSDYLFKLGLAITDIGSLNYDETSNATFDMNNSVNMMSYEGDVEAFLKENYEYTEEMTSAKIGLPTALHVTGDYNFHGKLFLNLRGTMSLISEEEEMASRTINTMVLTPRLETKWFSFYLPASLRQYSGFAMGAGFRLGPLTIGSGSVLTNLLNDSKTADVYAGLSIPIYKKNRKEPQDQLLN